MKKQVYVTPAMTSVVMETEDMMINSSQLGTDGPDINEENGDGIGVREEVTFPKHDVWEEW